MPAGKSKEDYQGKVMTVLLQAQYAHPIEREYEAWIVQGIETYFHHASFSYAIWAVSPFEEARWPADERLALGCKVVGLQFKQAKLAKGKLDFDRLHWSLHSPDGQLKLVQRHKEIYYCLPTFVNRLLRRQALEHCLFWRPTKDEPNRNVWYENPAAQTPYKGVCDAMRWGRFVESMLSCAVGKKISSAKDGATFLGTIQRDMNQLIRKKGIVPGEVGREAVRAAPDQETEAVESALYVLAVEVRG